MSYYIVTNDPVTPTKNDLELSKGAAQYFSLGFDERCIIEQIAASFEFGEYDKREELDYQVAIRREAIFYSLVAQTGRPAHEEYERDKLDNFINYRLSGADFADLSDAVLEDAGLTHLLDMPEPVDDSEEDEDEDGSEENSDYLVG